MCFRWVQTLSALDRGISDILQSNNNKCLELLLVIPAHMFNRMIILIPMGLCVILGALYHKEMLETNGYKGIPEKELDSSDKFAYGMCFFFLYGFSLLMMVICTQIMKYTIRRERP